ncbi:MAG TPA: cation diffusion facilitator family transporter [Candidatus Limnocylindria bacterium]|nr:cation diffusion facilitator family transporter [Candidatus Limnocylindria bacterium]
MKVESVKRLDQIARVLWIILALNLVVALAKLAYGFRSGAIAITADGIHSLLDGASNVLGLVGVAIARRPPDANHPYGHRKYETFAALGVVAMLLFGCQGIVTAAIERLRHPRVPEVTALGFAILGLTIFINLVVVIAERREGRRLQSELLLSDAAHTGSDVYASLLVLVSFAAARFGVAWMDLAVAGVIVGLILRAGFQVLKGTLSTLSDERRIDPRLVETVAMAEPGVREVHNVRSRGPSDDIHLDLHVLVDPEIRIIDAHALSHRVERRLREHWPGVSDVVVHVEPALQSERARVRDGGGLRAED